MIKLHVVSVIALVKYISGSPIQKRRRITLCWTCSHINLWILWLFGLGFWNQRHGRWRRNSECKEVDSVPPSLHKLEENSGAREADRPRQRMRKSHLRRGRRLLRPSQAPFCYWGLCLSFFFFSNFLNIVDESRKCLIVLLMDLRVGAFVCFLFVIFYGSWKCLRMLVADR
jgi:hypothetical protein